MHRTGDELFADATLAFDEDGEGSGGGANDRLSQVRHRLADAQQFRNRGDGLGLFTSHGQQCIQAWCGYHGYEVEEVGGIGRGETIDRPAAHDGADAARAEPDRHTHFPAATLALGANGQRGFEHTRTKSRRQPVADAAQRRDGACRAGEQVDAARVKLARHAGNQPPDRFGFVVVLVCGSQQRDRKRGRTLLRAGQPGLGRRRVARESPADFALEQEWRVSSEPFQTMKMRRGGIAPVGTAQRIHPEEACPSGAQGGLCHPRCRHRRVERLGGAGEIANRGEEHKIRDLRNHVDSRILRLGGMALQAPDAASRFKDMGLGQQAAHPDVAAMRHDDRVERRHPANVEIRHFTCAPLPEERLRENGPGPRGQFRRHLPGFEHGATERFRFDKRGVGNPRGRLPQTRGDNEIVSAVGLGRPDRLLECVERVLRPAAFDQQSGQAGS